MKQLDCKRPNPSVSIVVFFYNEAGNLPLLEERVTAVVRTHQMHAEIVLVNDSSTDGSDQSARQWLSRVSSGVSVRFSRNFGSHAAVAAGLQHCSGDCAVIMAADLQDPPELIPELVSKFLDGYDVVWACRSQRLGETWSTKAAASVYYRLMRWLGLPDMPPKGADFLLVSRKVVDAFNASPEKHTSVLAMILWMGFRQTFIQYAKQSRHSGHSKWTFTKKIKLLIDSVVSFSYVPIRAASLAGLAMATAGFSYSALIAVLWLLGRVSSGTGYAAIMCVLLIGQGAILLTLGVLGEYLWRTFDESRRRPRFIIDQLIRNPVTESEPV
jgi:glycosyltransferase involved in cell wall biosynthesis